MINQGWAACRQQGEIDGLVCICNQVSHIHCESEDKLTFVSEQAFWMYCLESCFHSNTALLTSDPRFSSSKISNIYRPLANGSIKLSPLPQCNLPPQPQPVPLPR